MEVFFDDFFDDEAIVDVAVTFSCIDSMGDIDFTSDFSLNSVVGASDCDGEEKPDEKPDEELVVDTDLFVLNKRTF